MTATRFYIFCKRKPRAKWDNYGVRSSAIDALLVARKNLADVQKHGAPEALVMVREYPADVQAPEKLSGSVRPNGSHYWGDRGPFYSQQVTGDVK